MGHLKVEILNSTLENSVNKSLDIMRVKARRVTPFEAERLDGLRDVSQGND
jgi:hypothetical protein